MLPSWFRRPIAIAGALAVLAITPAARAAAITVSGQPVRSFDPPSNIPGYKNTWINFSDCYNDLKITVPLTLDADALTGQGYQLQVWAGTGCETLSTRNAFGSSTQVCWPVPGNGQLSIPRSQNPNVTLAARDIIAQYGSGAKQNYQGPYDPSVCSRFPTGQPTITLYFLVLDSASGSLASATLAFTADLVGPSAPAGVVAGIGDGTLIVSWTPSNDTSGQTQGYTVYCDPPANGKSVSDASAATTTTTDAGTTRVCVDGGFTDGGTDDAGDAVAGQWIDGGCTDVPNDAGTTTTTTSTCPSNVLVSGGGTTTTDEAGTTTTTGGTQRFIDPGYVCGSVGGATSKQVATDRLTNGTYYTIAVAGIDAFGNTGPLSAPSCSTPSSITDFWSSYRNEGGLAGGGFCALGTLAMPASTTPLLVLALWGGAAVVRRRKKK